MSDPRRQQEWWLAIVVWLVEIDIRSFQKHLHYSLMPVLSGPRECRPAISAVSLVGIDVRSFQKHFNYPIMSVPRSQQEWCLAIFVWLVGIDIRPFQKHF